MPPYSGISGQAEGPASESQEENYICFWHYVDARSATQTLRDMPKPGPISAKPLSVLLSDVFPMPMRSRALRHGNWSRAGRKSPVADIAKCSEPLKIQWPRPVEGQPQEPATLVLRSKGRLRWKSSTPPTPSWNASTGFFGWHAVGRLALRQAPLSRRSRPATPRGPDPAAVAKVAKAFQQLKMMNCAPRWPGSAPQSSEIDAATMSGNGGSPLPQSRFKLANSLFFRFFRRICAEIRELAVDHYAPRLHHRLSLTGLAAISGLFSPLRLITGAMAQSAADVAKPVSLPDMALGPANALGDDH